MRRWIRTLYVLTIVPMAWSAVAPAQSPAPGAADTAATATPVTGRITQAPAPSGGTAPLPGTTPAGPPAAAGSSSAQATPSTPGGAGPQTPPAAAPVQPAEPARPAGPAPGAPAAAALPTLVPDRGDPNDVNEVTLPAKPAAIRSGRSTWDDGFAELTGAFRRIEEELRRAGIAPAGRPVTVFLETDDMGFRYEAMVPVERAPEGQSQLTPEIRFGTTPSGKALRFVHKAPYDDIDSTYETITAYLDAKTITVRDSFVEEYVNDVADASDPDLEINIFVFPQ